MINIFDRTDPAVAEAKNIVRDISIQSWVLLFEGERWYHIERVAVALENDVAIGLASLSPQDEAGNDTPEIIGVWVHSDQRRQGIATQLVAALSEEALRLYGKIPIIEGVTKTGRVLALSSAKRGVAEAGESPGLAKLP